MNSHGLILLLSEPKKTPYLLQATTTSQSVTPMNQTHSANWYYILMYTMISIIFLGLIYWFAETFFPQTSSELVPRNDALSARFISGSSLDGNFQNAPQKAHSNATKERITLALDRDIKIGKSIIVYRGLDENAKFRMDIAMLELDPNAFYRYRIPIKAAKKGFRLVGQNFKLITARKSAIQLWHLRNSRRSH